MLAGCTTSEWDTSGVDHPTSTTAKVYSDDEAGLVASLTDHLSAVGPNLNEWAAPRDEASCAAHKIVAHLGVDRLLDLGFDPQRGRLDLAYTPEEQTAVINILTGCIDVAKGVLSLISSYDKLQLPAAACFTRGIARRGLDRDFIAGIVTGKTPDPFARDNQLGIGISRLMIECFTSGVDLLPIAPMAPFPQDTGATTTTSVPGGVRSPTTTTP